MAYSLRYWYNNKLTDGKIIRLEIYKKDSAAAAMEIGDVVQGLSLNIDGGEDNIDAPIVSTSLVMTFCDAYDHPEADVKKCGNYAEFYTPDATLWKVVLLCKDAGASSFRTLWGGYVTPDSYEEDLTYRGSVTIVARDNIGHMADFPFDAKGDDYGTISFREVIEGAWAKIESPMSLVFHDEWMQTEGVSALDTRMNVSAFEEKSWHEAVEAALYSYGAVLRFIGDNEVKVSPLRYMPNYGGSVTHSEPVFMTGATRMLTPAVKRIEETASYELEVGAVIPRLEASDYTGETGTYRCKIDGIEIDGETFSTNEHDAPIWPISTLGFNDWYNGALATTLFFNVDAYDIGYFSDYRGLSDEIRRYMYIAANQVDARFVRVYKAMQSSDFVIKMQFGKPVRLNREYELEQSYGSFNLKEITYAITMEQNGVTTYYHGGDYWSATRKELRISFDATKENSVAEFPVAIGQNIGDALFCFEIVKIEYAQVGPSNETYGLYACIQNLSFDVPENISLLQTNRVNTNYNEENNVIITRDTAIAPAYNTTFLPSVIKNGIFYAEGLAYKPAKAWAFAGDTPQQMAVYNHLQLLSYYAKPNNVIEGSIVNGDVSRFAHIWQFEGKEHILVSGRYNFINGYIEGAILREFARYENLWGSTGGTQLPATETSNETNVEASASSSSSANTYENTTTVSIGMGGGGSSYLRDLLDVDVSASVKGSILCYNGQQWVDKSLDVLLTEMLKLGDWFYKTEDGKSIGTKYNLFSEGEMSANSLNLGGGTSGGGGLIQNVLGKSAFGTVVSEDNATTFNAYAIDSLYKRIVELEGKDVDVDLSDYYTKQQTQNAITSALSPYIKATDADGKYAALASFNALQSSFDRLYSALNDDTSGVINTWNEVVDFVNEYSGSEDLSTILGKMNTDINARVKVSDFDTWKTDVFNPLSVTVTNLGNKVNDHTDKINKILSWFELREDEDLLITTHNLASYKEISANGISQGTGGGGSGLISSVLGVGSLGATLTNDNSVVFNAYATNEIYKATQGHASRIGVLESQVGQLTTQGTKVSVSDLLTTGTKIATITVDGVPHEVKGDFLPTSGGIIENNSTVPLIINTTAATNALQFRVNNRAKTYVGYSESEGSVIFNYASGKYLGIKDDGTPHFNGKALLHNGNYSQYALPLTGGTISSNLTIQSLNDRKIILDNTDEDDKFILISFKQKGQEYGLLGTAGSTDLMWNFNTLLHSGNANKTDVPWAASNILFPTGTSATWNIHSTNGYKGITVLNAVQAKPEGAPDHYAVGLSVSGYYGFTLASLGGGDVLLYRRGSSATQTDWKTIAFTSDLENYLPLTGGTISTNSEYYPLIIKGLEQVGIRLQQDTVSLGAFISSSKNTYIHNFDSGVRLGIFDGVGKLGDNTLLHSGNIGEYAFRVKITHDGNVGNSEYNIAGYGDANDSFIGGPIIRFGLADGFYQHDIQGLAARNKLYSRAIRDGVATDWKEIAFTDSNVASAYKLVTSDGSNMVHFDSATLYVGDTIYKSYNTNILGKNVVLRYGASATNGIILNSSGNVTIGSSDLAGTDYKLYVDGAAIAKSIKLNQICIESDSLGKYNSARSGEINRYSGDLHLQYNSTFSVTMCYGGGNVGIGTTSPAHKLDVAGTARVNGGLVLKGELMFDEVYSIQSYNSTPLSINAQGNNVLLCQNGYGNVGVGTTDPTSALDVSRNASEPAIALHYSHSRDNNLFGAKIALVDDGYYHGNLVFRVKSTSSANEFASFYTDAMTIVGNNGNVLIGTTTGIGHSTAKMQAYTTTDEWASILYTNNAALMASHRNGYGVLITSKSNNANKYLLAIRYNDSSLSGSGNLAVSVMDNGNVGIGTTSPAYKLDVAGTLRATDAVTFGSTLTIAGATTHNGIAYFGGTTYYINTSGNANFNAISGSSLQVDSAAFNGTIHSNEYSGSVAKWSITKDGAASFASLSNGGLLETSTLRVSSTSTFTGKTNHNGGIGATSLNVSGTSTLSGHVGIGASSHDDYSLYISGSSYMTGDLTVNGTLKADDIEGGDIYITASSNLYLNTGSGYLGIPSKRWAIDGYGNYKGQSLYINPRDNDNEIIYDDMKKQTHGFPRENVAVFVNGDIAATGEISANAISLSSDIRFKHQLGDITLDLDTIANAPMFRFTWTNKENSRVQIGTSAQYWKDSARELVSVDKDDFHRLDYATLGVLIGVTLGKTVKNHEDRIKELEREVVELKEENRRLRYEC